VSSRNEERRTIKQYRETWGFPFTKRERIFKRGEGDERLAAGVLIWFYGEVRRWVARRIRREDSRKRSRPGRGASRFGPGMLFSKG